MSEEVCQFFYFQFTHCLTYNPFVFTFTLYYEVNKNRKEIYHEKIGDRIKSINFKKAFIAFIVCALAFVIVSVSYMAIVFQKQWGAAAEFANIGSGVTNGAKTVQDTKGQLSQIAGSFPGIIDIIVLDETGQVTYSVNNSRFAQSGALESIDTQIAPEYGRRFPQNWMRSDVGGWSGGFGDRSHFGFPGQKTGVGNFNRQDGYIVRSVTDNATGEQILFISNPRALWNNHASVSLRVVGVIGFLFYAVFKLLLCLWVYTDSKKHGKTTILWTALTLFTGLIGLAIYLITRGNINTCDKCGTGQSPENQFCVNCGNCLKTMCANCDTIVFNRDAYCKKCGAALALTNSSDKENIK